MGTATPAPVVTRSTEIAVANINNIVPKPKEPNYDSEVLDPLHKAQALEAAAAAQLAAEQAAQARAQAAQAAAEARAQAEIAPSVDNATYTSWMAQAGIAASDYPYVAFIVEHEGHWDACVRYGGIHDCNGWTVGTAYGVCQSLPGIKMAIEGADWATNPVTQLRWCTTHAQQYGGWYGAYVFWINHHAW